MFTPKTIPALSEFVTSVWPLGRMVCGLRLAKGQRNPCKCGVRECLEKCTVREGLRRKELRVIHTLHREGAWGPRREVTSCGQSFSVRTQTTTFISQTYLPTPSPGPFLNNPNFPQKKHCHKLFSWISHLFFFFPVNGNVGRWLLLEKLTGAMRK